MLRAFLLPIHCVSQWILPRYYCKGQPAKPCFAAGGLPVQNHPVLQTRFTALKKQLSPLRQGRVYLR